jgi:hypothetical protein
VVFRDLGADVDKAAGTLATLGGVGFWFANKKIWLRQSVLPSVLNFFFKRKLE